MAVAAGIGAASSILSGITGGKGAKKAAQIQAAAYQKGIDEQHRQFDVTQANFAPYLSAGSGGLKGILDLLGQNGNGVQQTSIDALKQSPEFTSLFNTGQDTILQNASATGGLRGGDTQNSLANFGSSLLSTVIQNHLANLGGIANMGLGSAGQLGSFGQATANNVSELLGKQGGANATAAAAPYAAFQGIVNSLGGQFGSGGSGAAALHW
jgi:hypothetical protein